RDPAKGRRKPVGSARQPVPRAARPQEDEGQDPGDVDGSQGFRRDHRRVAGGGDGARLSHQSRLHLALVDPSDGPPDDGGVRLLDVDGRAAYETKYQSRFLSAAMIDLLIDKIHDTKFLAMLLAAVAAMATVLTLAMPLIAGDNLEKRMKSVALEREKIRQRERERLARGEKVSLRRSPKLYMKTVVDQFNLNKWVGQEEARTLLVQAGHRGQGPYVAFLFFRMVTPVVTLMLAAFYAFVLDAEQPLTIKA